MPTNVVMPQMGESIAEGTIVRWIKKVGEAVDRDEPLFEISTDKVDAEIPAPAAGVLTAIKVKEGETVAVNSVVAVIGAAGEATDAAANEPQAEEPPPVGRGLQPPPTSDLPPASTNGDEHADEDGEEEDESKEDLRRQKSSPLVRRIAKEHDVDIRLIKGTGISGRVTKQDILGFIEAGAGRPAGGAAARRAGAPQPAYAPGESVKVVPMSVMRRKIAEHMVLSAHTSPHVYSVYEVNFGQVAALRQARKADYEAAGAKLTYTAFI